MADAGSAGAWFALAGALGGVALTGAVGLGTAALTHRWNEQARSRAAHEEEARAMRNQRREACHHYLVATNSFYQAVDQMYRKALRREQFDPREHTRTAITALQDAYVYLTISTGAAVRQLARTYNMVLYDLEIAARAAEEATWSQLEPKTHLARDELRAAMRAELGIVD
ncbi:hypothetical protein ACIA5D_46470 [Actinoplanes sp. NPDC051513]|uniref:hypothetical protein n=1 Tax=Actinoplanes sp. NPDC051513 TaxID=3363908 RepID=UPI003791E4F9